MGSLGHDAVVEIVGCFKAALLTPPPDTCCHCRAARGNERVAAYGAGIDVDRERHVPAVRVPPPATGCLQVSCCLLSVVVFVVDGGGGVGVVWRDCLFPGLSETSLKMSQNVVRLPPLL